MFDHVVETILGYFDFCHFCQNLKRNWYSKLKIAIQIKSNLYVMFSIKLTNCMIN